MMFIEILIARFLSTELHFLLSCVHLTIDCSNWFVFVPLHLAMKRRTNLVQKVI